MKVTCPISGLTYFSSDHFINDTNNFPVVDLHPIFRLPARSLLAKARNYGKGAYNQQEEKLLFLALLHSTQSIHWDHPADPNNQLVKRNIEQLFRLIAWYSECSPGTLRLPELRVTALNHQLENVGSFISAWYEVRQEWMQRSTNKYLAEQLEAREFVLHKLIHSSAKTTDNYAGRLASWAMDAAGIDDDLREEYTALFRLKGDDIFAADLDELLGMQATFQAALYGVNAYGAGKEFSGKVLEHIDRIVKIKQGGRLGALGGGNPANTFRIKTLMNGVSNYDDEIALIEQQLKEAEAPEQEPTVKQFGTNISAYVKAKAKWVLTQHLRDDLMEIQSAKLSKQGL